MTHLDPRTAKHTATSGGRYTSNWSALPLKPYHLALAFIFLLALTLRVGYNLTVARGYVPLHDAAEYNLMAIHLLNEHCLCIYPHIPTTVRPPLYPLFMAGVYAVSGYDPLHARLALSVVGACTCLIVTGMARILMGRRVGVVAGLIAATYPQLFIWDAFLYSESFAIFFFALCCYLAMRLEKRHTWRAWISVGLIFGLAALARPNGIFALLAVIIVAALSVTRRETTWRQGVLQTTALTIGCIVALSPWIARNAIVTGGSFVPFTTVSGIVVAGSYNDQSYSDPANLGVWVNPLRVPADAPTMERFPVICDAPCEVARSNAANNLGVHWAETHLADLPLLLYRRMKVFWIPASPPGEAGMPVWRTFVTAYPTAVILLAMFGALVAVRRNWRKALLPLLFAGTVVAGGLLFYGTPRMRAPMEPMLVVFAAVGVVALVEFCWRAAMRARQGTSASRQSEANSAGAQQSAGRLRFKREA
ncbi:MAG TPA: glycosyltransferase family 39 protein [Ktedonobacterales bacterium]